MTKLIAQVVPTERIETHVELARWSSETALLVGTLLTAVGIYAIVWMYRREVRGQLNARSRGVLAGLRVLLLVLLGFIALEPVLVNYVHRRIEAYTLVLVDESASMSLIDAYRRPTDAQRVQNAMGELPPDGILRAEVAERLLTAGRDGLLGLLAARNSLQVFAFSDRARLAHAQVDPYAQRSEGYSVPTAIPMPADSGWDVPLGLNPVGPATDVGVAVRAALDSVSGSPIAGVVLLSDGGFNKGESPATIAQMLKQRGVVLHAVGIGDPSKPINVSVVDVNGPRSAFKNDPFSITVRLSANQLESQSLQVELIEKSEGGSPTGRVVDRRTVRVEADGQVEPVVFERKVAQAGAVSYIARVQPVEYEAIRSDNEREMLPAVQILDDKMRVLLVAGSPSYDYRFLARMLERDVTVDVSTWLQSADIHAVRDGNTIITELPTTTEQLFRYDAIVLIDVDPEELDPTWGSLVAAFVSEHGGGLLYAAGNKYTGRFFRSPKTSSLVEILPIVPEPDAEILLNELGQYQTRAWPMVIPDAALSDPILRQSDNPLENRAIWSALDGIYWHYPVRREKPVAVPLIRHSNPRMVSSHGPHVLLATQFVGAGRSAYLGFNSTWRWRRHDEKYFNRFWIQLVRYLVEGRLLGGRSRGMILTPKDQYEIGETVPITVRALDERREPLIVPELELTAVVTSISPDNNDERSDVLPVTDSQPLRIPLAPMVGREGYYQGRLIPASAGTVHLSVMLPSGVGDAPADRLLERDITVNPSLIEMRDTALNLEVMEQLASTTGGRYLEVDEAGELATLIPDCSQTMVSRERPKPLWDNGYVLLLLTTIVTVEWILRRKARLL